jgi:hypothetical protein
MSMGEMPDSVLKMGSATVRTHGFSFFLSLLTEYRSPPLRFFGMKRAPQPLALLQSSYRQIDD